MDLDDEQDGNDERRVDESIGIPSDVHWVSPGQQGTPTQALKRLEFICRMSPDLHACVLAALGTHQAVPRGVLAAAILQFRGDIGDLTRDDVVGLITALWNGGKQGFDAVLRSRRTKDRKTASFPWSAD